MAYRHLTWSERTSCLGLWEERERPRFCVMKLIEGDMSIGQTVPYYVDEVSLVGIEGARLGSILTLR